jgi:hypothetical protein
MDPQLVAHLGCLLLSLLLAIVLYFLLRDSLRGLLKNTVQLPAGIAFYIRSFFLLLFFSALSSSIGMAFDLKPDSQFMEYVWKVANGLASTLDKTLLFVAIYVVVMTVLVATLKVRNDK